MFPKRQRPYKTSFLILYLIEMVLVEIKNEIVSLI